MAARILIIEDNAANLELLRYLLEHSGYSVRAAPDGVAGVAAAQADVPDLIICDLQMPLMNGYEVLAHLRQRPGCAPIPIVAVTAFSMPDDERQVRAAGFDGYFSKPIEPENFVRQMESFLPAALLAQRPAAHD